MCGDVIWYYERMRPTDPDALPHIHFSPLHASLSPKYISITPPLPLSPPEAEPSLCLSLTARRTWFSQYFAAQSQHLSGGWRTSKPCWALPPLHRGFYSHDLKAVTVFTTVQLGVRVWGIPRVLVHGYWLSQGLAMKLSYWCWVYATCCCPVKTEFRVFWHRCRN